MKTVLIKNTTVIDPSSPFHNKTVDILIEKGIISALATSIPSQDDYEIISQEGLCVSQGWMDSSVSFGEPGFEDRETIENGLKVAAKSGFTAIALQPNSLPVIDNQSQVMFVLEKAKNTSTSLYPFGALTKNSEGVDLAELFDMKNAGAIAFGDYNKAVQDATIQKIALQYVQDFDGLVIAFSEDKSLKGKGIVNEGINATQLGLKGIPALAEALHIARNLYLLEYTGGKLHLPTISTIESIDLIKNAKAKGLEVSCSVSVHHLVLTDALLHSFDSRYKVTPPLRDEVTRKALISAVLDGTIDCITSDHNPIDIEHKKLEFDLAKDGTIGLETAFSALLTVLPVAVLIEKLAAAKKIFGIPTFEIDKNKQADLTFFTTTEEWVFTKKDILSKSKNSAFLNQKMKGKVVGVYANGQLSLNK